jgi:hypothetical protein
MGEDIRNDAIQGEVGIEASYTPETTSTGHLTLWGVVQSLLWTVLLCGGIGTLFNFRALSSLTLPHIIQPDGTFQFQEVVDGFPVPDLLAWNLSHIHWMMWLDRLTGFPLWVGTLVSMGLLLCTAVRLLNPTFRPFHLRRGEEENGAHIITLENAVLTKFFTVLIRLLLPLLIVWLLSLRLAPSLEFFRIGIRALAIALCLWLGFSRQGMAGNFASRTFLPFGSELGSLLAKALLFGAGLWLLFASKVPLPSPETMRYYHTLGTFHRGFWWEIATPVLCSSFGVWAGSGVLLFALGVSRLASPLRQSLALIPLLIVVLSTRAMLSRKPEIYAKRWDINEETLRAINYPYQAERPLPTSGVPDGMRAGKVLLKEAGVEPPNRDSNPLLFFSRMGTANLRQMHYTEDGLPLNEKSERAVRSFLEKRNYQTALSWVILKHIYNMGTSTFDSAKAIEACILSLDKAPHSFQIMSTLQAMLFTCPATGENRAILDILADEKRFTHIDRASKKVMGDLYLRFGDSGKAVEWYRRAEMPKSFIHRVQTSKPMFNMGRISGKLMLNGKPLGGVRVGVHPVRLNGLPRSLEMTVLRSGGEIFSPFENPRFPLFPRFHPRPFALRWVTAGATTDAKGNFTLEHLIEGEYEFLCSLPSNVQIEPPNDSNLKIKSPPGTVYLGYNTPTKDLGTIAITAPLNNSTLKFSPKETEQKR